MGRPKKCNSRAYNLTAVNNVLTHIQLPYLTSGEGGGEIPKEKGQQHFHCKLRSNSNSS